MHNQNNFLLNISALYRNTNKYFDKYLANYDIGSGQMISLIIINENEGITMQQLTNYTELDKGTITKNIQKLLDCGYIEIVNDDVDRRVKHLYTTLSSRQIVNDLYQIRNTCTTQLLNDLPEQAESLFQSITDNSRTYAFDDFQDIRIGGLQKLTLLDYPGKVACTVFTSSCNLKCPFCHNKDLVYIPENYEFYTPNDILEFLQKRKGLLDAVCLSGGEPLLQPNIIDFMAKIHSLGYLVKLDTNGFSPELLKQAVESGNVNYVAMDIKNTFEKYALTTGTSLTLKQLDLFKESINYLLEGHVDYEFRTTVTKSYHTLEDLIEISKYVIKCPNYYIQTFKDSGNLINSQVEGYTEEQMKGFLEELVKVNPNTYLR